MEIANDYYKKANEKINRFSIMSIFERTRKYEEAQPLFERAANAYKLAKNFDKAADAYMKVAECYTKIGSMYEVGTHYINAFQCYKKCDMNKAVSCIKLAIELYKDEGNSSMLFKCTKDLAECYEILNMTEHALESYKLAAEISEIDNRPQQQQQAQQKIAEQHIKLEQYSDAGKIFELLANAYIDNNLLKFKVIDNIFDSLICLLATDDIVMVQRNIERYSDTYANFGSSNECKLVQKLSNAIAEMNIDDYTNAINEYDTIKKLKDWHVKVLLGIKNKISSIDLT